MKKKPVERKKYTQTERMETKERYIEKGFLEGYQETLSKKLKSNFG